MTTDKLHPLRCETCEYLSGKSYPAGSEFCLNSVEGFWMMSNKNPATVVINKMGCASHSSVTKRFTDRDKKISDEMMSVEQIPLHAATNRKLAIERIKGMRTARDLIDAYGGKIQ